MKSTVLWALIALNAMLATTFVLRSVRPNAAYAQAARPGDYIMLPGVGLDLDLLRRRRRRRHDPQTEQGRAGG